MKTVTTYLNKSNEKEEVSIQEWFARFKAPLYLKHGNGYDVGNYETLDLAIQALREKHENQILEKQEELVREGNFQTLDEARHNAELDFTCSLMDIKSSVYDSVIKDVEKLLISKGYNEEYAESHAEEMAAEYLSR